MKYEFNYRDYISKFPANYQGDLTYSCFIEALQISSSETKLDTGIMRLIQFYDKNNIKYQDFQYAVFIAKKKERIHLRDLLLTIIQNVQDPELLMNMITQYIKPLMNILDGLSQEEYIPSDEDIRLILNGELKS